MGEAFFWGIVAGSSLVLGGVIGLRFSISPRLLGLIMAFGSGVLISAVAYELVHEAFETSAGNGGVALGLLAGSAVFFACEVMIDRRRARRSRSSNGTQASGVGGALVLGIILDGIPESLVLGLTVLEAGTVSAAFLVAVFIANIPESIAATVALVRAGRSIDPDHPLLGTRSDRVRRYVPCGLRRARHRLAANRRHRARFRRRGCPDHARQHDDAGGTASRRQARRLRHDGWLRACIRDQRDPVARSRMLRRSRSSDLVGRHTVVETNIGELMLSTALGVSPARV